LRVLEEITRFILENPSLTSSFKKIRHKINTTIRYLPRHLSLLQARKSSSDVGKNIYINELKRKNYRDIFFANVQRIKESVRVLEEFSKLMNRRAAVEFKKIRYDIYEIEKKVARKIAALCNRR
jgi:thiamine-phosphate pyrophosphorylase